jgi:hypothetical protein
MRELGQDDPIYVADSALVTEDNLDLLNDKDKGCRFITRLPRTYKQCKEVVTRAVEQNQWTEIGTISPQRASAKRKPAHYRCFESEVVLYGRQYRALVFHSYALDKKSVKKFERQMELDKTDLTKIKKDHEKIVYACLPTPNERCHGCHEGNFIVSPEISAKFIIIRRVALKMMRFEPPRESIINWIYALSPMKRQYHARNKKRGVSFC